MGDGRDEPWLIMLIPYFGQWPAWIDLFVESCKWNPSVRWRFYTDCGEPENKADNIDYVQVSFEDYQALVRERLGIAFHPTDPYKLCDLRPCLAYIHEREIAGFRFFGYGDIDVVYGNIGRFYTDEVRTRFNVLSTHPERLSGHFAVLRNTPALRRAFVHIPNYRSFLERPHYAGMDEVPFGSVFKPRGLRQIASYFDPIRRRPLFVERYSTVLSQRGWHDGTMNYPQKWFWQRGRLTNDRDGEREFLYLHFMRWKSDRWRSKTPAEGEGAWLKLERLVHTDWHRAAAEGFCISLEGFTPITQLTSDSPSGPTANQKKGLDRTSRDATTSQKLKTLDEPASRAMNRSPVFGAAEKPDVGFVACIEGGVLEAQALLLFESIRRYAGSFKNCSLYALSPRAGHRISIDVRRRLDELGVHYFDTVLNTESPEYGSANRVAAAAYIEETCPHEILVILDSDTLFLGEPSEFILPPNVDVAVRPVDVKGMSTTGPKDAFDVYWHNLCRCAGVDYDEIPWTESFVDRQRIKATYNGGLVVVRGQLGILHRWADFFFRSIRLGLRPRSDSRSFRAGAGWVKAAVGRLWGSNQAALSLAIWSTSRRVLELPPTYNYPLHLHHQIDPVLAQAIFPHLLHVHYHWLFAEDALPANPLFLPSGPLSVGQRDWLRSVTPIT